MEPRVFSFRGGNRLGDNLRYVLIKKGLTDKGTMVPESDYHSLISSDTDFYRSLFYYDQSHYDKFQETGSMAGFRGLTTDRLYFDFDSKEDLNIALADTRTLVSTLTHEGIPSESVQVCFSGGKGFSVEVNTTETLTAESLHQIASKLAAGLKSFDNSIYNDNRIIREPFTKHQKSLLFKKPLQKKQLYSQSVDQIKQGAASLDVSWSDVAQSWEKKVSLPPRLKAMAKIAEPQEKKSEPKTSLVAAIDFSKKPSHLTNCKWALLQGHFQAGERHTALTVLAATFKSLGYDKKTAYYLCKSAIKEQASRSSQEEFSTDELWENILGKSVYTDNWNGGAYTCKKPGWLQDYCNALGEHKCQHEDDKDIPITLIEVREAFKDYVKNIDKNTVKTGIKSLDEHVFISTGANVNIIGAAGSGKSSIALDILSNTSQAGVKSVFASLDMAKTRMFEKVMYRLSGLPRDELYEVFQNDKEQVLMEKLKKEFGNVNFYSKSCPTVDELRKYVLRCQDENGEKVKLVMLDYFERISSDFEDDTQASKKVAGELQDMVNDLDIALITMVQPNKFALSGGPDKAIYDYTAIKGSSFIYQAARIILSMWRPFYSPKDFSNDRFMKVAVLKNDFGELAEFDMAWDGKRGKIKELSSIEKVELERLLASKEEDVKNSKKDNW